MGNDSGAGFEGFEDYKITLNPFIKIERFVLPRIEDLLEKISGGKFFAKVDLASAYQQMELEEESQTLTTICTHKGLFKYTRLPFGVSTCPTVFQKIIEQVLLGIDGFAVFQGDILVAGRTREELLRRLEKVLQILQDCGLIVIESKCEFFKERVTYLGFVIDNEGTRPSTERIKPILKLPAPKSVQELQSFLGRINYYRKFVPLMSQTLNPLYVLLKKGVKWNWTEDCQLAFDKVKQILTFPQVLVHYKSELPLELVTDASSYGIGAVLNHVLPNARKPIAYASRVLSDSECRYSQIEKEALAIFWGVKSFHQYLFGREFTLFTDSKPLTQIIGEKRGIPQMAANRLQRYAVFLSGYKFKVKYIKSSENGADFLSRLPVEEEEGTEANSDIFNQVHLNYISRESKVPIDVARVAVETSKDKVLTQVMTYVTLRKEILQLLHSSHFGIVKTKSLARSYVFWPGLSQDIEAVVKTCDICAIQLGSPPRGELTPWQPTSRSWERLHLDFFGPFRNKMFLVCIDSYSKWLDVFEVKRADTFNTLNKLREVFSRFGFAETVVTDNGSAFTAEAFQNFCKENGLKHITTPPYHPASNGQAENWVKSVKIALKKLLAEQSGNMEVSLLRYLFDYRATPRFCWEERFEPNLICLDQRRRQ